MQTKRNISVCFYDSHCEFLEFEYFSEMIDYYCKQDDKNNFFFDFVYIYHRKNTVEALRNIYEV